MKRCFLLYGFCVICIFFSQTSFLVANGVVPLSDDPRQNGLVESIKVERQGVTVEFFMVDQLPQAPAFADGVKEYKEFKQIPQDLPVIASQREVDAYMPAAVSENAIRALTASPVPSASFQGLPDSMRVIPPDTNGAVGPNHVVTMLNDRVRIQTKTGAIISTVALSTFWNTSGVFDPQLIYDPYNNRWIALVVAGAVSTSSAILVAVSQTSDPTGAWYRYRMQADPTGQMWADFPRLGFNNKWVVVQTNMFGISSNTFSSKVIVLNKAQLYAGSLGAVKIFDLSGFGGTQTPAFTYDNSLPALYLLQNWTGNSGGNGYLRLYAIEGAIGSETIRTVGFPAVNQTWSSSGPFMNGGFAPQLGTTVRIDANDSRMSSVVYRNGSLWGAHTVFLPQGAPVRSAIQWWQINPVSLAIQQFGRIEDPSANLNTGTHYAFPSIAVNMRNDVLIGYSRFNPTIYASAAYSFRLGTDPVNTMQASNILKAGLAPYTKDFGSGEVRWGDYSSTVVDPNGLDLWTLQEYADALINGQSSWATWWGEIALVSNPCP